MSTRYHISPKTGNPNVCRAQWSCPFGHIENDHYETKEDARAGYEKKMAARTMDEVKVLNNFEKSHPKDSSLDFDSIGFSINAVRDYPKAWTDDEKENFAKILEIDEILRKKSSLTSDEWDTVQKIKSTMHPLPYDAKYDKDQWKRRDDNLLDLADNLIVKRVAYDSPASVAPKREASKVMGLREAQLTVLNDYNDTALNLSWRPEGGAGHMITKDIEGQLDSTLDRIVAGETYELKDGVSPKYVSLIPERDRLFSVLASTDEERKVDKLYLATAFPEVELKDALDRNGVDNVSATGFTNGRENGIAYTVMQPDGSTRTFSVYEHRNSDSIIINGKANWDGKELPYGGDSSHAFFAEFAPDDTKQAADALAFFMKEAQKGELQNDNHLMATASKRDWNAILSKTLPGFKEWSEKQYPKTEDDDDPLKHIRF